MKKDLIYTCYHPTPPVIDGHLGVAEWAPATKHNVTLYNLANQADTILIRVMALYTEENNLIFGITVPDTDLGEMDDHLAIVFKTASGEPLVQYAADAEQWHYGKYHDIKYIYSHNNHSTDGLTTDTGLLTWDDDLTVSGTEDSVGKCHPRTTVDEYELEFPLNSGDTAGKDPSLAINDDIEIFFYYKNDGAAAPQIYTQIREDDGDYDYNALRIACTSATPISLHSIIISTLTISMALIIYRKKK